MLYGFLYTETLEEGSIQWFTSDLLPGHSFWVRVSQNAEDIMDTQLLLLLIFLSSHIYFGITEEMLKAVLTVEPNTTVFRGEAVDLKCKIEGQIDGYWWYLWQKKDVNHDPAVFITPWKTENAHSIHYTTESDSGMYNCIARQSSQYLHSNSVSLTVLGLPRAKVIVSPETSVFIGETVTLKCEIDSLSGWTYRWYKGTSADVVFESEENTFSIRNVFHSDEGQYWCRGQRSDRPTASESSGIIFLLVNDLPAVRITFLEPRSPVFPGETVALKCEINTFHSWTYKWYKELSPGTVFESEGNTFTITSAAESDEGQYWCQGERTGRPSTSQHSRSLTVTVNESPAKPDLSLLGPVPLLTGQSIILRCELESGGWLFHYYKTTPRSQPVSVSGINEYSISSVRVSDGGQYWCRAGRGDPVYYTQYSSAVWVNVTERPKPVVTLQSNWTQVFRGEIVTLRCDIQTKTKTNHNWEYSWYINGHSVYGNHQQYVLTVNDVNKKDKYTCRGRQISDRTESDLSEALTLNMLAGRPQPVLGGPPQSWLTEGDSVTLSCEVRGSSTGWTFHWYKTAPYRPGLEYVSHENGSYYVELLSDSSRGAGGSYTLCPAALRHTGVYVCRAERGETAYSTEFSQPLPVFITGLSSANLVIRPSRSQHFTRNRLSITCEVQGNSTGWTLRWFTKKREVSNCPYTWEPTLGPGCTTDSLSILDSGTYWCQSDTNEESQAVNITVHNGDVIIESPAHPVSEGHRLSLRCLYRIAPSDFSADFFKDRSPLKTRTSGEMTIAAVSKADEGLYQCDNTHRGISPDAWVVVKASEHGFSTWIAVGVALVLVTLLLLVIILALLFHSKKSKGRYGTTDTRVHQLQSSSHLNQEENRHLDGDTEHIYATVNVQNGEQDQDESTDLTYAHIELKQITNEQKINNNSDKHAPSDVTYASVNVIATKPQPKVEDESTNSNVTYAVVNVKAKKKLHAQDH